MTDQEKREDVRRGPVGRSLATSVHGNSQAFGFSIMITGTFGVLASLRGSPRPIDILLFGLGAALAVAVLEAVVTRGFRAPAESVPSEVEMLGTALNFISVGAGLGAAIGIGHAVDGVVAWPLAAALASTAFILLESSEVLAASAIQRRRGDPQAETSVKE